MKTLNNNPQSAAQARKALRFFSNPDRAKAAQKFFKTEKGGYGEKDRFIGVTVPQVRGVAKDYKDLDLSQLKILIRSRIHEDRLLALIILSNRAKKSADEEQEIFCNFYLEHRRHVNNWDLIDTSAEHIVGPVLSRMARTKAEKFLRAMATSENIWDRRMAMMATFYLIRRKDFQIALQVADILLCDEHDLIHKAVGWMLREIGNRDLKMEQKFLQRRYRKMPRTMLRYAIEKFPEKLRQAYLQGQV